MNWVSGITKGFIYLTFLHIEPPLALIFPIRSLRNQRRLDVGQRFLNFSIEVRHLWKTRLLSVLSALEPFMFCVKCDYETTVVDRLRTFVRPVRAADMAPLAGMVIRGPGPNLQQRARGSEKVSGFPDPDHVDHVPIQIMTSSQLGGPSAHSVPDQAPISTGPR